MISRYGFDFPDQFTSAHIELWAWRNYEMIQNPETGRWEHLRNAALYFIPGLRENYHYWFEQMCQAYAEHSYIAAIGCSNSSKTWSMHTLAYLDYMSDPKNTQVICTTTSVQGLKTRMWPILSGHYRALRPAGWVIRTAPHMMIQAEKDDPKHSIRAVPIAPKADKSEITDNIIGAHTDRVIWLVDEATSAPEAIFAAWSNLAGGTRHRRLIMLGNPDDQLDTLGRFCRPLAGWDSVNADSEEWKFTYEGEKGIALHFDGEKSPNLQFSPKQTKYGMESKWSFLFGHADLERHKNNMERDPLAYWRFCRGWYADGSIVPKVLTMSEIDQAGSRGKTTFYGATKTFASLDPAFGGDRPMLKIWKMGACSESGKQVMEQIAEFEIPLPPKQLKGEAIGKFVIKKSEEFQFESIGIDTTTDNSAPAEYIKLNSNLDVIDITFGGRPSEEPISPTDPTLCCDKYDRKVSELWFTIKQVIDQIRGLDEETCIELCSRYFTRKGRPEKLCVETKQEMKKRAHGKSPDKGDCVAIGVAVFRKLGGFDLPGAVSRNQDWKKLAKRRGGVYHSEHAYT